MATFGLQYVCEFCSKYEGKQYHVEISQRGYFGVVSRMKAIADNPLTVTWEKRGDELTEPIKASEAVLQILCYENFAYTSLFTSDPRQFRMTIYIDGKLYWRGFLVADTYSEPFAPPPYSVSLEAVDGFSLLKNLPFVDNNDRTYTGVMSLMNIATKCIDCLELDMPVEEWIELYQSRSDTKTLANAYIETGMMYDVYNDCTYLEALELCLKEFAAQIFQAQGVIHIRRIASLTSSSRPQTFYINDANRPLAESLWSGNKYIDGSSELQIVPGLRSVEIKVENTQLKNIVERIGIYNSLQWTYSGTGTYLFSNKRISFGTGQYQSANGGLTHNGYDVKQCVYAIKYKFSISGQGKEAKFIIKLVSPTTTYYFNGSTWQTTEITLSVTPTQVVGQRVTYNYDNVDYQLDGFPTDGKLILGLINNTTSLSYNLFFYDFEISLDVENIYDGSLEIKEIVNNGNNKSLSISIPLSDIPDTPNNKLIYSLYLIDAHGSATTGWTDKSYNTDTLINHLINTLRRLKYAPRKQISGRLNCPNIVDLNTVVRDDKYTKSDYYVNYLSLDAINDSITVELNESISSTERPAAGDDCVLKFNIKKPILNAAKCGYKLFLLCAGNVIYIYDIYSSTYTKLDYEFITILDIFDSVNCVVVIADNKAFAFNANGKLISSTEPELKRVGVNPPTYVLNTMLSASYNGQRDWITLERNTQGQNTLVAKDIIPTYGKEIWIYPQEDSLLIQRDPDSFIASISNQTKYYDYRLHNNYRLDETVPGEMIIDVSSKFIVSRKGSITSLYFRDGIQLNEIYRRIWKSIPETIENIEVSNDAIAIELSTGTPDKFRLYCPFEDKTYKILNAGNQSSSIVAIKIMYGDLYIILSSGAIWKYVRSESNPEVAKPWTSLPQMKEPCVGGTAASVNDKIYILGGNTKQSSKFTDNCYYNPSTKTYTTIASSAYQVYDISPNSPVIGNSIYVYGGQTQNEVGTLFHLGFIQIYNTLTNTWSLSAWIGGDIQYSSGNSTVAIDGKVHVMRRSGAESSRNYHKRYDPSTNTWTSLANLPYDMNDSIAFVIGAFICVAGGFDSYGDANRYTLRYSLSTNSWTTLSSLNVARGNIVGAFVRIAGETRFAVTGGYNKSGISTITEYFNMSSWELMPDWNAPIGFNNSCVTSHDGVMYIFGGMHGESSSQVNLTPYVLK